MPTLATPLVIETTTIKELPSFSAYGPLTTTDYAAWWLSAFNKTVKVDAQALYTFFQGGGGGSIPPVVLGDKVIHVVTLAEEGGTQVVIPSLAGKQFFLERDGYPMLLSEFNVLNAGGFELNTVTVPDAILIKDQRFVLSVYSLQGGASSTSSLLPLISGVVNVPNNMTFDVVNHVGKLIQLRGGTTQLQFTLPSVDDIPDNTIIPIEASIGNTVEHRIATQSGQLIYINNVSKTSIYMRAGEVVWLYRADDGYYILNDFAKVYKELARPVAAYSLELNELVCQGQLVKRSDYPRTWERIQSLGSALVTDSVWNTPVVYWQAGSFNLTMPSSGEFETIENPYRGCFSAGDITTGPDANFRLPNLMGMHLRGVTSLVSSDATRYHNKPGGFQKNMVGPHEHSGVPNETGDVDRGSGSSLFSMDNKGTTDTNFSMGENLVDNTGVIWVIKV